MKQFCAKIKTLSIHQMYSLEGIGVRSIFNRIESIVSPVKTEDSPSGAVIRESGESPEQYPLLYTLEFVYRE